MRKIWQVIAVAVVSLGLGELGTEGFKPVTDQIDALLAEK